MKFYFILLLSSTLLGAGCSNTKHLSSSEKLYTGASVTITGVSSTRERKTLKSDLSALTRPKPNSKLLGIPLKLNIYNLFRKKKANSFWGRIRDKNGEPPVLLSQVDLQKNSLILQNHLENKGYFHAKVSGDTVIRRKKASARYQADTGPQYKINMVHFPTDSSELSVAISKTTKNTLLKKGAPFDLDVIKGERTRIDAVLKENGFYYFSPDHLLVKADSTIGNNLVDMYVVVKPETPDEARQIHKINDVFIYSGYSLNTANLDTLNSLADYYKGYHIIDRSNRSTLR